jgi:uncharacterized membrane protein YozB (DUF420 family)
MQFNQIVQMENVRGRSIFNAVVASGGTITTEMRKCMRQLDALAQDSVAGEAMDQLDAALAVNLADEIGECKDRYANGVFWSLTVRAKNALGSNELLKVMLLGVVAMVATFVVPLSYNLTSSVSLQLISVGVSVFVLAAHSVLCAGCIIGKEKAGVIREFIAVLFLLMPIFAVLVIIDDSNAPRLVEGASIYRTFFVSFFYAQGFAAFALSLLINGLPNSGNTVPNSLLDEHDASSYLSDPQYSSIDLGYTSDATEI